MMECSFQEQHSDSGKSLNMFLKNQKGREDRPGNLNIAKRWIKDKDDNNIFILGILRQGRKLM